MYWILQTPLYDFAKGLYDINKVLYDVQTPYTTCLRTLQIMLRPKVATFTELTQHDQLATWNGAPVIGMACLRTSMHKIKSAQAAEEEGWALRGSHNSSGSVFDFDNSAAC